MKNPIMLIDAYNLFARNYIVNPSMSKDGNYVGGALGTLRSIGVLAEKFKPSEIIVCWEGGGSARRRKILPEYKRNRKPIRLNRSKIYEDIPDTRENFNYQVEILVKFLSHLPVKQLYVDECEADDIIGYISRNKYKDQDVLIVSMDQDFHQLINDTVKQYSPSLKKVLDKEYVLDKFGISTENFVTARAFIGDGSDNIDGIRGIGFKTLSKKFPMLQSDEFVSVQDILIESASLLKKKKLKVLENIVSNKDIPHRNWKLMYLDISNLSAEHVKNLEHSFNNATATSNKFGLIKSLNNEGIELTKSLNIDRLFLRLKSINLQGAK